MEKKKKCVCEIFEAIFLASGSLLTVITLLVMRSYGISCSTLPSE